MSTQINVVVGQAGLSAQAKAQTAANRQAKLEGDAQAKAVTLGQQQRDAQAADPYGLVQQRSQRDEPSAARNGTAILLVPDQAPFDAVGSIYGRSSIRGAKLFAGLGTPSAFDHPAAPTFYGAGGPGGMAYLEAPTGLDEYALFGADTQQIGPKSRYDQFTLEFYHRIGDPDNDLTPFPGSASNPYTNTNLKLRLYQSVDTALEVEINASRAKSAGVVSGYETIGLTVFNAASGAVVGGYGYDGSAAATAYALGSWRHYCVVKRLDAVQFYVDGQPVTYSGGFGAGNTVADAWNGLAPVGLSLTIDMGSYDSSPPSPCAIHGLRFKGKALYPPAGFVPPPAITTL